ncbi:BLUF domain-containing protein [Crenalkalicoccus roseus]|uniref:BLUF domain-containing protein n=1 Tax=Crenalkalicoccus roseus TaxID=1485588 RepID=UPI0013052D11|nr:BLUF domain-containing protein [Crenalkalicoccus roseus]
MELFRVIYISRNLIPPSATEAEIGRILEASRRRNAALGVTGALLFSEGAFAQVLEGPLASVEEVFETIQADPRHREVVVLEAGRVPERAFPEWHMAYVGPGATPPSDCETGPGAPVLALLRRMARRAEAAEA